MKKVFITGASSGIGEALARHYASEGAQLGLLARRADWLEKVAASISPRPEIYVCDVRDVAALKAAAQEFIDKHGAPDIVIANAGVSRGTLTEIEDDLSAFQRPSRSMVTRSAAKRLMSFRNSCAAKSRNSAR